MYRKKKVKASSLVLLCISDKTNVKVTGRDEKKNGKSFFFAPVRELNEYALLSYNCQLLLLLFLTQWAINMPTAFSFLFCLR